MCFLYNGVILGFCMCVVSVKYVCYGLCFRKRFLCGRLGEMVFWISLCCVCFCGKLFGFYNYYDIVVFKNYL